MRIHLRDYSCQIAALLMTLFFVMQSNAVFAQALGGATNSNSAASSNANANAAGKKEKKTNLNFEDELVEGQTSKPELFYLFQKKNFNYKRLIRLRENFLPEMRKTSEDIQRSRSSN